MLTKVCTKCNTEKNITEFSKDSQNKDKKSWRCKVCAADNCRIWNKNNSEYVYEKHKKYNEINVEKVNGYKAKWLKENPDARRSAVLKYNYGITLEQKIEIYILQKGVCAICTDSYEEPNLHVDHNHKTGKVRGLLCFKCNTTLGKLKEDLNIINNMINYIKNDGVI